MSEENNSKQIENGQDPNDKEQAMIWDLEVWKRAQQTQFKAYLKQLEFEYLSKLQEDFKNKEDEREKEFKSKINEINNLNIESLDDLFDDGDSKSNEKGASQSNENVTAKEDTALGGNAGGFNFDDELSELLFDDEKPQKNDEVENDDLLDIQKELEAKFDELFGAVDND